MKIAIFGKTIAPENEGYLHQLVQELENNHVEVVDCFNRREPVDDDIDLLLSIGGDGTLLDAVPLVGASGIPILGINMGRLGFISSVAKEEIPQAVRQILNGHYATEDRTLLELVSPNNVFGDVRFALNEINIIRNPEHSLLSIKVFVDDVYLNTYWGDRKSVV